MSKSKTDLKIHSESQPKEICITFSQKAYEKIELVSKIKEEKIKKLVKKEVLISFQSLLDDCRTII